MRIVKTRLLSQHGLVKYKPLVGFNAKLMILSIAMDGMLIGLMSLPNQVVFIQFHPVAYMVKLNIEMSMASLITRLAKDQDSGFRFNSLSYSQGHSRGHRTTQHDANRGEHDAGLKSYHRASVGAVPAELQLDNIPKSANGIHRRVDVEIRVDQTPEHSNTPSFGGRSGHDDTGSGSTFYKIDDEDSLTGNPGHPRSRSLEKSN